MPKHGKKIISKGGRAVSGQEAASLARQGTAVKMNDVVVTGKNKKKKPKGLKKFSTSGPMAAVGATNKKATTDKKVKKYAKAKAKAAKTGKARHYRKANRKYKKLTE